MSDDDRVLETIVIEGVNEPEAIIVVMAASLAT